MANPTITTYDVNPLLIFKQAISVLKTIAEDASGVIPAGAVLGEITLGAASSAAKSGGNTGNGTLVLDATNPKLSGAKVGVYTVRCIIAGTHIAKFEVADPDGNIIGHVEFSGTGSSQTFANQIKFEVTDGSTDFVVGDGFDITIAAGSGKLVRCDSTALDGSQYPKYVIPGTADATEGDLASVSVVKYGFAIRSKLVFKGSETLATKVDGKTMEDWLHERGIYTVDATAFDGLDNS